MISLLTDSGSSEVALKGIARGSILTGAGEAVFWLADGEGGGLEVKVIPNPVTGAQASGESITIATRQGTAFSDDGTAPYSFAWSEVSNDGGSWSILTPSAESTGFRHDGVSPNQTRSADFKCTITDARGRVGEALLTARVTNYGDQSAPFAP